MLRDASSLKMKQELKLIVYAKRCVPEKKRKCVIAIETVDLAVAMRLMVRWIPTTSWVVAAIAYREKALKIIWQLSIRRCVIAIVVTVVLVGTAQLVDMIVSALSMKAVTLYFVAVLKNTRTCSLLKNSLRSTMSSKNIRFVRIRLMLHAIN